MITIRPLRTIPEFREVIALEQEIWGSSDPAEAIGVPIFVVTVKRGGILLGAYDGGRLIGFVYSLAGLKDGKAMHWSHMLAVRPEYRAAGVGRELKLEQRRLSLAMGIELMEWTFDPLVAINGHFNFRRLGVIVEDYVENVYGDSSSPLHRGAPTDRFIAQWRLRSPAVDAVLARAGAPATTSAADAFPGVARVNTVEPRGTWLGCGRYDVALPDRQLVVTIPANFPDMLERQADAAHAWRMASREIFSALFSRGYRAVDFAFAPEGDHGAYLLEAGGSGS